MERTRWIVVALVVNTCACHIYHNEFAVHIPAGAQMADRIAEKYGYENTGQIGSLENYFLFRNHRIKKRSADPATEHHEALVDDPMVDWAEQQVEKKRVKRDFTKEEIRDTRQFFTNPFSFGRFNFFSPPVNINPRALGRFPDPLYRRQWYLAEGANDGFDMNVVPAWSKGYTGKGVVVSILDDGIQHSHPDLRYNYDPQASTDINNGDPDPMPRDNGDNKHGTRCAGEVAAIAFNDICGVGVAYNASIGGVRMLDGTVNDAVEARAISLNPDHIDIYSASWGPEDDGKTVDGPGPLAKRAFINGVIRGRHGKGSIFVWASGNGGRHIDNCNCDGYTNSIFTLSISSASQRGSKPWYLEECSSTLATTYSSGTPGVDQSVVTADMDGPLRPDHICTTDHTGTSASAPLAAGICALALEANPDLTWRDMQHIVVRTSRHQPLSREEGWFPNGVGNYVSHKFGYGLMDAGAMVDLAAKWTTVPPQHVCQTGIHRSEQTIPTTRGSSVRSEITTDGCAGTNGEVRYLEHVQARVSMRFLPRGNINIQLISPSGTFSTLLFERPRDVLSEKFDDWPFLSVHFWGEKAAGTWQLVVTNAGARLVKEPGVLIQWQLILHGTKDHPERIRQSSVSHRSFSPNLHQFGGIIFSESAKHEVKTELNYDNSLTTKSHVKPKNKSYNNTNITCHSECFGGCVTTGPSGCHSCKHYSLQEECVHSCPPGTYAESKTCLPCHGSCATCVGPRHNQCASCSQSMFVPHLGMCVETCPLGYFSENGSCVFCSNECAKCSSISNCTSCEHHLVLHNGSCVASCPRGYFENDKLHCEKCHRTCDSCVGRETSSCASCGFQHYLHEGKCVSKCPKGTYGDPITRECYKCRVGCASCEDKNECTSCKRGWVLKNSFCLAERADNCKRSQFIDESGVCQSCHKTCLTCFGPSPRHCSHCHRHLAINEDKCVLDCPDGQFKYGSRCLACAPGCALCTEYLNCSKCKYKYFLHENHCYPSCANGFYTDGQSCSKCHYSCSTCWGPGSDHCLTCRSDLVHYRSSCVSSCPEGQYEVNKSCQPCFHNCKTCNGQSMNSCTSCKDFLTVENGTCLECTTGRYFNSTSHSCQSCHETCLSCFDHSRNGCTSCQHPLSLHSVTSSCRMCCQNGSREEDGNCCYCDPTTGKCYGSVTTDKRRIASYPLHSKGFQEEQSMMGSTISIVALICLVNIFIVIVVYFGLQYKRKQNNLYSYQAVPLHGFEVRTKRLHAVVDDSDSEDEYSTLYTTT